MNELAEGAPCRICGTPIADVLLATESVEKMPLAQYETERPGWAKVTVQPCGDSWWIGRVHHA